MNTEKGTIYLIQPAELVGTGRYKIGCSSKNDLERCKKGYKKGTRFMDIRECDDPFAVEREVKTRFNTKFNLVAGNEYFEGNETDIKKEFNDVVSNFTSLKCNDVEKLKKEFNDVVYKFTSLKCDDVEKLKKEKNNHTEAQLNHFDAKHFIEIKHYTLQKEYFEYFFCKVNEIGYIQNYKKMDDGDEDNNIEELQQRVVMYNNSDFMVRFKQYNSIVYTEDKSG